MAGKIDEVDGGDREPDTIATPERDNEFAGDQPLQPVEGLEAPRGNAPAAYDSDEPSEAKGIIQVIDEISRGKLQP
jgi:hypothetical protein